MYFHLKLFYFYNKVMIIRIYFYTLERVVCKISLLLRQREMIVEHNSVQLCLRGSLFFYFIFFKKQWNHCGKKLNCHVGKVARKLCLRLYNNHFSTTKCWRHQSYHSLFEQPNFREWSYHIVCRNPNLYNIC